MALHALRSVSTSRYSPSRNPRIYSHIRYSLNLLGGQTQVIGHMCIIISIQSAFGRCLLLMTLHFTWLVLLQLLIIHVSSLQIAIRVWLALLMLSFQGKMWIFDFIGKASHEEVDAPTLVDSATGRSKDSRVRMSSRVNMRVGSCTPKYVIVDTNWGQKCDGVINSSMGIWRRVHYLCADWCRACRMCLVSLNATKPCWIRHQTFISYYVGVLCYGFVAMLVASKMFSYNTGLGLADCWVRCLWTLYKK